MTGSIKLSPFVRQCLIVATLNLSIYTTGCGVAWSSPALVKLKDENSQIFGSPISDVQTFWIISSPLFSGLLTTFICSSILDRIGRKYSLIIGAVPKILCYLIMVFATEVWMLILARFLLGISQCISFVVAPTYSSEIASIKVRGALGSALQLFSSVGIVTILLIGPFMDIFALNALLLIASVVTTIPNFFLPESPYFLHKKGKKEEVIKVLLQIRSSKSIVYEEIKNYDLENNVPKINLAYILKSKTTLKSFGLVIFFCLGVQLSGATVVNMYLEPILVSTNTSMPSDIASVVIGCIDLLGSILTMFLIDTFGRKPIIVTNLLGAAVGMIGLGTFFELTEMGGPITGFLNYLPLASLILAVFCFSAGLMSLIWPVITELLDGPVRAIGVNLGVAASNVGICITTQLVTFVSDGYPALPFWLCSSCAVATLLFVVLCVPETKGKSFAEIQITLGRSVESVDAEIK